MASILALLGSKRKIGNCDVLLAEAVEGAREAGAEVEVLRLTDLNIEACRGCLSCVFKGTCAIKEDDMSGLISRLVAADGLLLAAPTYVLSPAAVIKIIADRSLMFTPHLESLKSRLRAAVTISVAGNAKWNPLGMELLNQFALIYGYPVLDYLEAYAPGPGEVLLQPDLPRQARALGRKLAGSLAGKEERRPASENQCPVCYGKTFRLAPDGGVTCPICMARGKVQPEASGYRIIFDPESVERHFWTIEYRQFHLGEWILPSRDRYQAHRIDLKKLRDLYR